MKPMNCLTAGAAALLVAAVALPATSFAGPRITKLEFGHSDVGHRPVVPVIRVRFAAGQWRLVRGQTHFDLKLHLRVDVRRKLTSVRLIVPGTGTGAGNTWRVFSRDFSNAKRGVKIDHIKRSLGRFELGDLGRKAIAICATRAPTGLGRFRERSTVSVKIIAGSMVNLFTSEKHVSAVRSLSFDTLCEGRPTQGRSAGNLPPRAGTPFRVTGAGVRLKAVGNRCPRAYFATVRIFASTPGTVRYVLRSSRGRKWTQQVFINFRNDRGVYEVSFDHRFVVTKSTREKFWIEIDGQKMGRPGQLNVRCLSNRPKSLTN